ncbi:MAG TPA: zinc ABC transporter substrate-binding protein [Firmicutes bacterium]|nr:zinc ABC transporter substrate-binding protein [Bacillota bacterium]
MKKLFFTLILIFLVSFLVSCPNREPKSDKPVIITSIFPLADIIRNIAGEEFDVIYLIKPGQDPHSFEPDPETMINIKGSKLIFKVGFGFEFWLEQLLSSESTVIDLSENITPIDSFHRHETEHHHKNKAHSDNEMKDPHYWLSPKNILIIIPGIESGLRNTFPGKSEVFEKNAALYTERILELDKKFSDTISPCPNRKYIAYHPAWLYLSRDYNLEMRGILIHNPSQEPLPGHLAEIIDLMKDEDIHVIFSEKLAPANIPEIISNETGAKIILLDPLGGTGGIDSYIKLMEYNLQQIHEGICGK